MNHQKSADQQPPIVYSCYYNRSSEGEQFVSEHSFTYQISGSLVLNDGKHEYSSGAGKYRLIKRNQLLKFNKIPPDHGEFRSISVRFDQDTLRNFSLEYNLTAKQNFTSDTIFQFDAHNSVKSYFDSLVAYHETSYLVNQSLIDLKLKEGIWLILQIKPELQDVLFDFSEPHKIDLEAFMNEHFHFNVSIERFAYLTGRSLATFKRDFEKIFNNTPGRWLLHKRLQEAYYLIKQKGKTASDVYIDLGFEDLSHFSYAFKKAFGESPSRILH